MKKSKKRIDKQHHFVVRWTEKDGWQLDSIAEEEFPDGSIWNPETGEWEHAYFIGGKDNDNDGEIRERLEAILERENEE